MKLYLGIDKFKPLPNAIVTSGTFDGVHIGHSKIIQKINQICKNLGGESVIITYWPHPRLVLYPDQTDLKILSTFEEKASLLQEEGVNHLIKIPFTKKFSNLTSQEFIEQILVKAIGTKKLVIGYNHRFGKNREGSFEHLINNSGKYGFEVEEIPKQDIDHIGISSTLIRKAFLDGDIIVGNEYLGREYNLTGKVIFGDGVGKELGFPTANIKIDDSTKLVPADGIYAVKVNHSGNEHKGMLYIGPRPTLNGTTRKIEVNIFDFEENIYDDYLTIYFHKKIRGDHKFENLAKLSEQLVIDRDTVHQVLNN